MRSLGAAAACAFTVLAIMCFSTEVAGAQAPSHQGWWTVTNPGASPGIATPLGVGPPDVPSKGLLVEGGSDTSSPIAYAALIYDLPSGSSAGALTLQVAPNAVVTPGANLEVCPLNEPTLQAEQGGPMSDAPAYSCTNHLAMKPSADGQTYEVNLSSLARTGVVAVAILPVNSTDRVVLSQPGPNSFTVQPADLIPTPGEQLDAPSPLPAATFAVGNPPASIPESPVGGLNVGGPSISTAFPGNPAAAAAAAPKASGASDLPKSFPALPPTNELSSSGPAKPIAVLLVVLAALAGAGAWAGAGRTAIRATFVEPSQEGS